MPRRETVGDKIGDKIGEKVRSGMLQIWEDAKKFLDERELDISLAGLEIPLLERASLRIGLVKKQ